MKLNIPWTHDDEAFIFDAKRNLICMVGNPQREGRMGKHDLQIAELIVQAVNAHAALACLASRPTGEE